MTYAAITGWGKCLPPAVLSERRPRYLPRHQRRVDHEPDRDQGTAHLARAARRSRLRFVDACARGRGARSRGRRADRGGQLQRRRSRSEPGVGPAGAARCATRGCHGRQHGLHELSLRTQLGERDGTHRRRAQCAGRGWRADQLLHGMGQPRRLGAVRRRLRCRRDRGDGVGRRVCSAKSSVATATHATRW